MKGLVIFQLMKVYACASMFDKGCDVYQMVLASGLEPDGVMYGGFLRFADKAGRKTLLEELLRRSEGAGCIKTYFRIMRKAAKDGNVQRAIMAFNELRQSLPASAGTVAYNIAIDACCSNGDLDQALRLADQMNESGVQKDRITFNTILKGFCRSGDLDSAKHALRTMEEAGVPPCAKSYSCLLSCAARLSGTQVLAVVAHMDSRQVTVDGYILAIVMQAACKAQRPQEAQRMLSIMDRPGVKVCEDDFAFDCVLEVCIAMAACPWRGRTSGRETKHLLEGSRESLGSPDVPQILDLCNSGGSIEHETSNILFICFCSFEQTTQNT